MAPTRITTKRAPDAAEPPRERRPARSRSAGPRAGRSLLGVVAVAVAVGTTIGFGGGALVATGAVLDASSVGLPCAAAGELAVNALSASPHIMNPTRDALVTRRG